MAEKIIETRLGRRTVDADKILHFPQGLAGFEDRHDFTLLQIRDGAPFLVLQSMDDPQLGLVVADPYSFLADYTIKIGKAEQSFLGNPDGDDLAVLVTVSIPPGKPEETALNLTGPILINHKEHIGLQIFQPDLTPDRFFLNQNAAEKQGAEKQPAEAPVAKSGKKSPAKAAVEKAPATKTRKKQA